MSPKNLPTTNRPAALVTGGAVRIGRAMALFLARSGFDIALHYHRSEKAAKEVEHQINELGATCRLFQADLSRQDSLLGLIPQVKKTFSTLRLLINNAAIFEKARLVETEPELFDRHVALNFKAPFFLARDFARCVEQGQIINIVDQRIDSHRGDYFAYSLTKKSLAEMTKMAAAELGPHIRVNAIAPGFILPPADPADQDCERLLEKIPLKRQGSSDTICQSVKFFIDNDYVTGQILFADGGEHL